MPLEGCLYAILPFRFWFSGLLIEIRLEDYIVPNKLLHRKNTNCQ
ncbi:hypothetical protein OESDEN_12792 [Oesophagostomum dentatum]|uniref:Uncharacterized protein n=1 Tax=Oesophagostomum dentatum TaxID=61180 RepID=A0A0B1SV70_OESDE|nr:hypothetical protein OESDEN_12792 [Oesophagostomum dentatum]